MKISNDQVVASTHRTVNRINAPVWTSRGQWMAPRVVVGKKTFELVDKATGEVVDAVSEGSNLLVSYRVPYSDGLYRYLSHRTFTYDQAVASIVAVNSLDEPTATRWIRGLLSTVSQDGQIPFSVNQKSGSAIDPYYRVGAEMWGFYAFGWYLQEYPDNAIHPASKRRSRVVSIV